MRPNPNPPTVYSSPGNDAETNIDNAVEDAQSRSEASPKQRASPPRMQSFEIHDMDVDGGSEQKQIANELPRSRKRARSESNTPSDEQKNLISTEPINKKQRIHESDVSGSSSGSSSASSSSSSASTIFICKTDNRRKIREKFTSEECNEILICFSKQENSDRVCTLLYGDNPADWPQIKPQLRHISYYSDSLKLLLSECGAVRLKEGDRMIFPVMENFEPILYPCDFNLDRFRSGLLEYQQKQHAQLQDLANDTDSEAYATPLKLAAEWGDLKALQLLLSDGESTRPTSNNIENALIAAALNGHIEIVQLLLTHIIDREDSNISKQFALSKAAAGGHYAVCELLLNHGASLNIPDENMPLHIAAEMGRTEICKLFIQHGADIDQKNITGLPPLYFAARHNRIDACKLLLSLGADFSYFDPIFGSIFSLVIANRNIEIINDLLERGAKVNAPPGEITPLMEAASTGNPEIVKILLAKGAEINSVIPEGITALSAACRSGSLDTVKLLLNNGADPNGDDRDPPFVNAAECGSPSIIQLLINSGAIVFSDDNIGYQSLRAAVLSGRIDNVSKLLELKVPVKHTVIDQEKGSLLIAALKNLSSDDDVEMLELLLKNKLPLKGTNRKGNDALMLAVMFNNFNAVELLIKYGATVALKQTNKKGENVLQIAIAELDSAIDDESNKKNETLILASLFNSVKNNSDWPALQSTIINTAENTFTREVISTSLVWPLTKKDTSINDVVKTTIDFSALEKLIQSIVAKTTPLSRKDIYRALSVVGIYSAVSEEIYPYLVALPHIQFSLFGNTGHIHNKTISSFIAGLGVTLENIRIEHGEQWNPYKIDFDNNTIFSPLTQIANGQLTQLIDTSIATETTDLAQVFGTLSEICFNASFTAHSLPAIFPPYQAAPGSLPTIFPPYQAATGAVTNALLVKGVYAVLAPKIETAWKKVWEKFTGTPLSSDSILSNSSGSSSSSSSSNSSSSSSRTTSTTSIATVIDGNDMDDFFSSGDLSSEWIDELYVPPNLASFLESVQGQALLQAFRDELRLAFDQVGSNILDLPKGATEVPAEVAKIYSELMFRQLHMLKQFIEAE